jgi:hypothetical protein
VIQSCAVAPQRDGIMWRQWRKKIVILGKSKNVAGFEINVNTHNSIQYTVRQKILLFLKQSKYKEMVVEI